MRLALGAVAAVALFAAGPALADEPGLANKVYSPYVKKGVSELELRAGRLDGKALDGESGAVVELEQGVSDRLSLAVAAEYEHGAGERTRLDSIGVEGVAYLGQVPGLGVDVGGYLEYEQRIHNESGVVEAKLLLAKQAGPVQTLLNLIVQRPLTDKHEDQQAAFGYALQSTYDTGRGVAVGLQAYGDLGTSRSFGGRQAHFAGPVALTELHPAWTKRTEIELQAAYLFAVGPARREARGQARFEVELEKRF